MALDRYLEDVANDMRHKSAAIRRDFARHRPSGGANREDLVERFLTDHLRKRFGVSTGLVISHDGMFSNQADLLVVDDQNNVPLHPQSPNKLWPVEAVYALIEVKTILNLPQLTDAIRKGQKFKRLPRKFCQTQSPQFIDDSLFVIWSFESPKPTTLKNNLIQALSQVPRAQQPDFVIVPDRLVAKSGSYLELARLGHPNSPHRQQLQSQHGQDISALLPESVEVYDLSTNSLFTWYVWFDSWLRQAGPRFMNPVDYLPPNKTFGKKV